MRHLRSGRKLKRTASHRRAMLNNMATSLLQHKKIATTEAKAKELRPFVERLITKAKNAYLAEQAGQLQNGHTVDVHARRTVGRYIKDKAVLQELFDAIAPVVENRPGGYCRIIKTGTRHGDGGRTAVIELVDWAEAQDGKRTLGRKKKRKDVPQNPAQQRVQQQVAASVAAAVAQVEEAEAVVEDAAPEAAPEEKAAE
ncbi:MAG: 50S ribosomal protein L17 [Ignavibacteria bacterium]|nr:50S ribosomal protein L17 [Ignavibacteria bacterium]MBL7992215.1 50S ribosomal protein L17 [Candidatus Kapabacteria bacterium]